MSCIVSTKYAGSPGSSNPKVWPQVNIPAADEEKHAVRSGEIIINDNSFMAFSAQYGGQWSSKYLIGLGGAMLGVDGKESYPSRTYYTERVFSLRCLAIE